MFSDFRGGYETCGFDGGFYMFLPWEGGQDPPFELLQLNGYPVRCSQGYRGFDRQPYFNLGFLSKSKLVRCLRWVLLICRFTSGAFG